MGIYSDITRQSYQDRNKSQQQYNGRRVQPKEAAQDGFQLGAQLLEIGLETFMTLQKAKGVHDAQVKDADSNFRNTSQIQGISGSLDTEAYQNFVNSQSDKIKEGTRLTQKYGSRHEKYIEGQDLITGANQAVRTAVEQKAIWKKTVEAQCQKNLQNMDNTSSSEAQGNSLQACNGTFLKDNDVFIDDNGYFMYERKTAQKKIFTMADKLQHQSLPNYVNGQHHYSDEVTVAEEDDALNNKNLGFGIPTVSTEGQMNLKAVNPKNTYTIRSGPEQNTLVTTTRTNINEAPFGFGNKQLEKNSMANEVVNMNEVYEEMGAKQNIANGGSMFDENGVLDEESSTYLKLQAQITMSVDNRDDKELASFAHNALVPVTHEETINGKTVKRTVLEHPAQQMMWHRNINNPELTDNQLAAAMKVWVDKDGKTIPDATFDIKFKGDPDDDVQDRVLSLTQEKYAQELKRYKIAEMGFAQGGKITQDDRKILKDILMENAKHANQVGDQKFREHEAEQAGEKLTPSHYRAVAIKKLLDPVSLDDEKPMTLEGLQGIHLGADFKIQQDPKNPDGFLVKRGGTQIEKGSRFNKYDKQGAQRVLQMYSNVYQEDRRQDYEAAEDPLQNWNNATGTGETIMYTNFKSEKSKEVQITGQGTEEKPFSKPRESMTKDDVGKYFINVPSTDGKAMVWNGERFIKK